MEKIFKRFWLLMTMFLTVIYSHAYDFTVGGIYYNIISIPDMTCEVTFGEEIYSGDITVPSTVEFSDRTFNVTKFNISAFKGSKITSIKYPDTITELPESLFQNCTNLFEVTIGNNIKDIGVAVFCGCTNLKTINFSSLSNLTKLPKLVFADCKSLNTISLPNSITHIESSAFKDCENLTHIDLPSSLKSLSESSFEGCLKLETISIPTDIFSIPKNCFKNCETLQSVEFNDSLQTIEDDAFYNCKRLKSINLPDGLTTIRKRAFMGNASLTALIIPESVDVIGIEAFRACSSLNSVNFNSPEVTIKDDAFEECPIDYLRICTNSSIWGRGTFPTSIPSVSIYSQNPDPRRGYYITNVLRACHQLTIEGESDLKKNNPCEEVFIYESYTQYGKDHSYCYTKNVKELKIGYAPTSLRFYRHYSELNPNGGTYYENYYSMGLNDFGWPSLTKLYIDRRMIESGIVSTLTEIIFGSHTTEIQVWGGSDLQKVICESLIPPVFAIDPSNTHFMNLDIEVPAEALETYKNAEGWKHFWNLKAIDTTGVNAPSISNDDKKIEVGRYNINGQKVDESYQGIVIIRYSDGSTRKIVKY